MLYGVLRLPPIREPEDRKCVCDDGTSIARRGQLRRRGLWRTSREKKRRTPFHPFLSLVPSFLSFSRLLFRFSSVSFLVFSSWITRGHHWSNYSASWTVCRWDCESPRVNSATTRAPRGTLVHGGSGRWLDGHPLGRHHPRFHLCRSQPPYHPTTDRCCRNSRLSGLDTRLKSILQIGQTQRLNTRLVCYRLMKESLFDF